MLHAGEYGTVCDDSWDIVDAHVVCRMLNMGNATRAVIRAGFGTGKGTVWLDEVKCVGESSTGIDYSSKRLFDKLSLFCFAHSDFSVLIQPFSH